MRKWLKYLLVLCVLLFSTGIAMAQNYAQVGYGDDEIYRPFGVFFEDAKSEYTFSQTELECAGLVLNSEITSIGWLVTYASITMDGSEISINGTTVWSGSHTPYLDWNDIILTTPFVYTGGSLTVEYCFNNTNGNWSWWDTEVRATYSLNSYLYRENDGVIGCNLNANWDGDYKANIRFGFNSIYGCMDPLACNYDLTATSDDGSCITSYTIDQNDTSICSGTSGTMDLTVSSYNAPNINTTGFTLLGSYQDHTYYLSNSGAANFNVAEQNCIDAGGYIVTIETEDENTWLETQISSSIMIGYYQNTSSSCYSEPGGGWEWANGSSSYYNNWKPDVPEPNDAGNEHYTMMYPTGYWNDITFSSTIMKYVLEIEDKSILWDNGTITSTNNIPIPTSTTTYTATITEGGCSYSDNITITVLSTPLPPTITPTPTPPICLGDDIILSVTSSLTLTWDKGIINNTTFNPSITDTYTATVTSTNGCSNSSNIQVIVNPVDGCTDIDACNYDASATCDDSSCVYDVSTPTTISTCPGLSDGEITVLISVLDPNYDPTIDAAGGYTYTIDGVTTVAPGIDYTTSTPNLFAASYDYTFFVNGNDCGMYYVTIDEYTPISTTLSTNDESCFGLSDGNASVDVQGASVFYSWSTGAISDSISDLPPGSYDVEITDSNSCVTTENFTINSGTQVTVLAGTDQTICDGYVPSSLNASASTGTYSWTDALGAYLGSGSNYSPPPLTTTTTYTVTFTETSSGCTATDSVIITVTPLASATIATSQTACLGSVIPDLFAPGSDLNWYSDAALTNSISTSNYFATGDTAVGLYTYYVTESLNGCEGLSDTATLEIYALPTVTATASPLSPLCAGDDLTLTGGGTATSYTWTDGISSYNDNVAFTPAVGTATYTVTGTNTSNSCTAIDSLVITVDSVATVTLTATPNPACIGDSIFLTAFPSTTVIKYRFRYDDGAGFQDFNAPPWSTNANEVVYNITQSTDFKVKVREDYGCTDSEWSPIITVPVNPLPTSGPIWHN